MDSNGMIGSSTLWGGGYWTCSRCGQLIQGSSIYHHCDPIWHKERLIKLKRLLGKMVDG